MQGVKRIALTGAAGQISYSLLFRIAAGELLGPDTPVVLQLLELPGAMSALKGVAMELQDGAFPLLQDIQLTSEPEAAFKDADFAFFGWCQAEEQGMERGDLLEANAEIFSRQGQALNAAAKRSVKVLVVGNPANTNALITAKNAPEINPRQIHAMMRLDHNRALYQLAEKLSLPVAEVQNVTVWGNHSATQYPDVFHAKADGAPVASQIDPEWLENAFIPRVQKRGAEIIEARGASSAASAANAAILHMRDWVLGTPDGTWVTMGVPADGTYGIPEGVIFGFPCRCHGGDYEIVQGLAWNDFSASRIRQSHDELLAERNAIARLL